MTQRRPARQESEETTARQEEGLIPQHPCTSRDCMIVDTLVKAPSFPSLVPCGGVNNHHIPSKSSSNVPSIFPLSAASSSSSRILSTCSRESSHVTKKSMTVHFSRVLQVREVQHRKDMSPLELQERWDIGVLPAISRRMFEEHELVTRDTTTTRSSCTTLSSASSFWCSVGGGGEEDQQDRAATKRRRRNAYLIRRKVLSDMAGGFVQGRGEEGDSLATVVARNYSQNSEQSVREAHIAALKHAHEVAVEDDMNMEEEARRTSLSTRTNDDHHPVVEEVVADWGRLPVLPGATINRHSKGKRMAIGSHPLAAVKRLRNNTW